MYRFSETGNFGCSPFLPLNLRVYEQRLRIEAKPLLYGHTVFPYVVAFMAPREVIRLENQYIGVMSDRRSNGSFLRPFTKRFHRFYFCPECSKQDLEQYGESYWHVMHNLPGVQVCVRHGSELKASDTQVTTLARLLGTQPPHLQSGKFDKLHPHQASLELARASAQTFEPSWEHHADWPMRYRKLALTHGYMHSNDCVSSGWLAHNLRDWYGERLLHEFGAPIINSFRSWPTLLTRVASCPETSPLRYILMKVFLEHHGDAGPPPSSIPPGKKPRNLPSIDGFMAKAVQKKTNTLNLTGRRTTVKELLEELKVWHIYRHNSTNLPLTSEQLRIFRSTEASVRKAGGRI